MVYVLSTIVLYVTASICGYSPKRKPSDEKALSKAIQDYFKQHPEALKKIN